jgi:hypothetical protein
MKLYNCLHFRIRLHYVAVNYAHGHLHLINRLQIRGLRSVPSRDKSQKEAEYGAQWDNEEPQVTELTEYEVQDVD